MAFIQPKPSKAAHFLFSGGFFLSLLSAQTPTTITNSDRRPLVGALDQLQSKIGIIINYEDVPYVNAGDLEDVSTPQQRASAPGFHQMVPRGGTVSTVASGTGDLASLNSLLTSYRAAGLPGDFTIEHANGQAYVIASKVLAVDGAVKDVVSAMKLSITLPYSEQEAIQFESAIFSEIGKATGVKIAVGSFPRYEFRKKIGFGASNEPARDVLARLLAAVMPSTPLSYRLLFDPLLKYYVLNLQPASPPVARTLVP
jgi:hypothetical protein